MPTVEEVEDTIYRMNAAISDAEFLTIYERCGMYGSGGFFSSGRNTTVIRYMIDMNLHESLSRLLTLLDKPENPLEVPLKNGLTFILRAVERGDDNLLKLMVDQIVLTDVKYDISQFSIICERPLLVKALIPLLRSYTQQPFGNDLLEYMHRNKHPNKRGCIGEVLELNLFELLPHVKEWADNEFTPLGPKAAHFTGAVCAE